MSDGANDLESLRAEVERLLRRLEAAEQALADERRAFVAARSEGGARAQFELSPQALADLANAIVAAQRRRRSWRRGLERLRRFFP